MKKLLAPLFVIGMAFSPPAAADNVAGCEIVLKEKISDEKIDGTAEVASFRPAGDFIESVYDDDIELIRKVDDAPIRAVMCKRQSIVPSMRDYPIAATGIPFILSQNFDADDTGVLTGFFKGGEFQYNYIGPDLTEEIVKNIDLLIDGFNLQSNDLAERETAMQKKSDTSEIDASEKEVEQNEEASESDDDKTDESNNASASNQTDSE